MKKYALVPIDESTNQVPTKKLSTNQILDSLPKNIRNKVRAILNHINQNGDYIQWNEKGEITIDGESIPNSQIVDLIKCCFYPYKDFTPEGLEQFKVALSKINTPQTLIGGGGLKHLQPPPGLPTKKRKQWVWHQM